jgi:ribosomal protein S18 acetylase RimI-like enzyme
MSGWTVQWNGNVPAWEKTRLFFWPWAMLPSMLHEPSSRPTACGAESAFVHVITSPTDAVTFAGSNLKSAIAASTVVASVVSSHGAVAPAVAPVVAGAADGGVLVAAAVVGAVVAVPPPQAASTSATPSAAGPRRLVRMSTSKWAWVARHDTAAHRSSSYGSCVAGVRISDPELARRLVLHEARAQQTPVRQLRDLGDGWLFHDSSDAEPFWNRLIAPRWPSEASAFERRLDEITTLFATLDRLPHIRPLPSGCEPPDLAQRLEAAGFEVVGSDRRMVLVEPDVARTVADRLPEETARGLGGTLEVTRHDRGSDVGRQRSRWGERRRWAEDASLVLAEAFAVETRRVPALENDVLACVARARCSMLLIRVDGEPAAVGRRATTPDGSYLSSIGTRPAFRRHGLGALATALLVIDALHAGSSVVHLAVEAANDRGRRLYERLGFAVVGDAAPDLLLR